MRFECLCNFQLKVNKYILRCTCWIHEVEVAESIGGDQGVRVDDGGGDPDAGEAEQQDGGEDCDRSLHEGAVRGFRGIHENGNKNCHCQCQKKVFCTIIILERTVDGDSNDNEDGKADGSERKVAQEGSNECQSSRPEENMRQEVQRGLQCCQQGSILFYILRASYPPFPAAFCYGKETCRDADVLEGFRCVVLGGFNHQLDVDA